MKIFKHIETGQIIKEDNPNHYSIYEREGYVEVDKEQPKSSRKTKKVNK